MSSVVNEKSIVNMPSPALLATGGSTNHAIHLVAMARSAAGVHHRLDRHGQSVVKVTPLLARVYPNGSADVNAFQAAGGVAYIARELAQDAGHGPLGRDHHRRAWACASLFPAGTVRSIDGELVWRDGPSQTSLDLDILRPASDPFLTRRAACVWSRGNLGRAVIKISAVKPEHLHRRGARRSCSTTQEDRLGRLQGEASWTGMSSSSVVRFQGPKANGMPELHSLTPTLGVLLDKGFKVALVTDGRMSGASGKVPAAIHVTPEAEAGGPLALVRDGDMIRLDAHAGTLELLVDPTELAARSPVVFRQPQFGYGRELFSVMRTAAGPAEAGASVLFEAVA